MPVDAAAWEDQGITLEHLDVLSASSPPQWQSLSAGYISRAFTEQDWGALTRREIADGLAAGGYDPAVIEEFVVETNAARRRLCAAGNAAWFGAFFDGELVANLGIVKCGTVARFQSVETQEPHRRRGLAAHLLGRAADWSLEQGCQNWVIVTEETNAAGRLYRRAGFTPDASMVNAYRK